MYYNQTNIEMKNEIRNLIYNTWEGGPREKGRSSRDNKKIFIIKISQIQILKKKPKLRAF